MTRTVHYEARHKAIAEGGVEGIAAVLRGDDEAEKASLLSCLGFTLIYIAAARRRKRAKISPFCGSCFNRALASYQRRFLRLLGDYCDDFRAPQTKISAARSSLAEVTRLLKV